MVEGQEVRLRPRKLSGNVDQPWVHRKVGQAAAIRKQWLAWITVELVLLDGVLDVLSSERILEFGRKEGKAVEEEPEVQAVLVLLAVVKLAHHGKEIALVKALQLLIEAARRAEVSQPELAPGVLDALSQHIQRSAPLHLLTLPPKTRPS